MSASQFDSLRLRWQVRPSHYGCRVTLAGSADLASWAAIRKLEKELRGYTGVILDVTDLEFADSTFFRFLLRLQSSSDASAQRDVRMVGVGRHLQRILEVTGLARMFSYDAAPPVDPTDAA